MRVVRERGPDRFTVLDNGLYKGKRLSYRAVGLYGYLIGRPDGWNTDSQSLADLSPREGREAVRTAMRELIAEGLVKLDRRQHEGGRWVTVMVVFDTSVAPKNLSSENRAPENRRRMTGRSVRQKTDTQPTSPETPSTHTTRPAQPVGAEDITSTTTTPQPGPDERDPLAGLHPTELAAELRVLRRERDLPTTRWTGPAVERALLDAVDAGYADVDLETVVHALKACATDPDTHQPGRLKTPGPWWDVIQLDNLANHRAERQARAAEQRRRAENCTRCDRGWIELPDGTQTRCSHEETDTA